MCVESVEYDPNEHPKLLAPLLEDEAGVVLGSRSRAAAAASTRSASATRAGVSGRL